MEKKNETKEAVWKWISEHADADGNVRSDSLHIALSLALPVRTVQTATQTLESEGEIARIRRDWFSVVSIADPELYQSQH